MSIPRLFGRRSRVSTGTPTPTPSTGAVFSEVIAEGVTAFDGLVASSVLAGQALAEGVVAVASMISGVPTPLPGTLRASFLDQGDGSGIAVIAPIIGQPLYINPGAFSDTPTSYHMQVYADGVAVLEDDASATWNVGDPMPAFTPGDAFVGALLVVKVSATNGVGTSLTTNDSTATAAVLDIDLAGDTPANTRTTLNTVVPMRWITAFGSKTFPWYIERLQVASDLAFTAITQEVTHVLTAADLVPGATIDWYAEGYVDATADQFLRSRIEAATPSGVFRSSGWASVISPTDYVGDAVTDNFDDGIVAAMWAAGNQVPSVFTIGTATIAEASSATLITPDSLAASTAGRKSANAAPFRGKFVELRLPADFDVVQQLAYLMVGTAANHGFLLALAGNGGSSSLHLHGLDGAGGNVDINGAGPFFGTYRWMRMEEDAATPGHILVRAAPGIAVPTSGSYTTLFSFAYAGWNYLDDPTVNCYVWYGGGNFGANASMTNVSLDDFNTNMAI